MSGLFYLWNQRDNSRPLKYKLTAEYRRPLKYKLTAGYSQPLKYNLTAGYSRPLKYKLTDGYSRPFKYKLTAGYSTAGRCSVDTYPTINCKYRISYKEIIYKLSIKVALQSFIFFYTIFKISVDANISLLMLDSINSTSRYVGHSLVGVKFRCDYYYYYYLKRSTVQG